MMEMALTVQENNDLIGWIKKNNHAACAAVFFENWNVPKNNVKCPNLRF